MDKILFCGCHFAGRGILELLLELNYNVTYVVCLDKNQGEKYSVSGYYNYLPVAQKLGLPVYIPEEYSLTGDRDKKFFSENSFDLMVQGGWQRLFPDYLLAKLGVGGIGVHGSSDYLPKGRGRSPMNWALVGNRKRFIMSLFLLKQGVDDGDVFDVEKFDITPFDDIETMYYKYNIVYKKMLSRSLSNLLSGKMEVKPQIGEPTYYPKRTPKDGEIDWENMDVWFIYDLVRATTKPYPGAFAMLQGREVKIWKCRVFDTRISYPTALYGDVVETFGNKLVVNCRGGLLLIDEYGDINED